MVVNEAGMEILKVILPILVTAMLGYISAGIKVLWHKKHEEDNIMKVLLRREIDELYDELKDKEYLTVGELHEFDEVYNLYTGLGGNGRGKIKYQLIHRKEIKT